MEIFCESYRVSPEGLCTGDLFRLMQKVSGDHCREIGYGEPVMEEKGLMWVITRHVVSVLRWPEPGEQLLVRTWPGPTRHGMCPRYYRIESENGELLITGCAIWSVVGRESRKMVAPEAYGVAIEPFVTGLESRRPCAPLRREGSARAEYTVSEELLDEKRHRNNTRYYDLAEQLLGTRGKPLREALVEYSAEAREGDTLLLDWSLADGLFVINGSNNGAPAFRMNLRYEAISE